MFLSNEQTKLLHFTYFTSIIMLILIRLISPQRLSLVTFPVSFYFNPCFSII